MTGVELAAEMHCRSCEQRVRRGLEGLDGVLSIETDLKRQRVAVEFDDGVVDESEVRTAVANAVPHGADSN